MPRFVNGDKVFHSGVNEFVLIMQAHYSEWGKISYYLVATQPDKSNNSRAILAFEPELMFVADVDKWQINEEDIKNAGS